VAGLDVGRDDPERVDEPGAVDEDHDQRPVRDLELGVGELFPAVDVEGGALAGALAVEVVALGLRGVALEQRGDLVVDAVEVDPPRVAVDLVEHPAAVGLVADRPGAGVDVVEQDAGLLAFAGLLRDGLVAGVPGVGGLQPPAAHSAEVAPLRVGDVAAAVALRPQLGLVLDGEGDALPEPRPRAAGDRLDLPAARQVDARDAGVGHLDVQRAAGDHRHERAPDVVGLVLAEAATWIHGVAHGRPTGSPWASQPSKRTGASASASAQIIAALNGPLPHFCGRTSWPPRP
jgi:hypothetical protein